MPRRRLATILAGSIVVAACVPQAITSHTPAIEANAARAATPGLPSIVSTGDVPSGPAGPGCIDINIQSSSAPPSVERTLAFAGAIIDGTFRGYGAPRWNTPSGRRPEPDQVRNGSPVILRPLVIDPARILHGEPSIRTRLSKVGGELGCDRVTFDNAIHLAAGSRYVFFLVDAHDGEGQTSGDLILFDAWPVDEHGFAGSPGEGPMTLDALATRIAAEPRATN